MRRVAFITGAGRRIGRHIALRLAEKGWGVAVHYGASKEQAEQTAIDVRDRGGKALTLQADVRRRDQIQGAIKAASDHFGRLDLLVNNAGLYPRPTPVMEIEEDLWRDVIETNLYGEYYAAQGAARVMMTQEEGGRIVNLASLGSFQIWRDRLPYNVSKAGVVQLTRALARALAPRITVNAVAPGVISIPDDPAPGALVPPERIPMRRHGSTDDIFRAVWFFAAESSYITGQVLLVDGGLGIAHETSQE